MLLGAEIGMFAAGLIMLVKGNLPSMENDPNYSYDTSTFRLLSIIPMIPLPFAIIAGIVLGLTAPEALRHMAKLEWGMLILALIVYSVGYVLLRQPRGSTGEQPTNGFGSSAATPTPASVRTETTAGRTS